MTTLFVENFETDGNGTRYTTSIPEFSDGAGDFFTRTNGSNIGSFYQVLNPEGSFYFAAQDIDGEGAASEQTLTFSGIDIAGFTNLNFSTLLAEDDDGSNQDWDLPDFVLFEYQIDGAGFRNLLAIESVPDGDAFNAVPAQDTDFDGDGDGTEVTDTFASFSSAIAGTGSTLDLRITFDLDSRDEDLAIDNIEITGDNDNDGGSSTTPNLVISEIMFNPASAEDDWEWVEIYNAGSRTVDISGYVLDDFNSVALASANIASGSIAPGANAILYNADDVSATDFTAAWGEGINLVGVTDWSALGLNNNGDTVGLWDSFASYQGDNTTQANALVSASYPNIDDGFGSVYLNNLADQSSFVISTDGVATPAGGAAYTSAAGGGNSGEDIGSPGGTLAIGTTLAIADVSQAEGNSGTTAFEFTVTRSGDTSGATTVDFITADGTAVAGSDYAANSGTLNFAAGERSQTITVNVTGDTDAESDETFSVELSNPSGGASITDGAATGMIQNDDNVVITPIYDIQGASQTSPFVTVDFNNLPANTFTITGDSVTTNGIVTAVDSNGFYLQDPTGDGNDATSDALFVFTNSAPGVSVGDELQVEGTVAEFFPGDTDTRNLPTTQISSPTITNISSGNTLPDAVIIGSGGRVPPTENIDDDAFASFDPTTDGIDFFESLEGMRVTAQNVVATAPTNRFGEIFTVVDNGVGATGISDRGTLNISPNDFNPEKIQIDEDTGILPGFNLPQVDVGAQLGDVTGVVSYDFGNFQIQPTQSFTASSSTIQAEVTNITPGNEQLTVASYNVLNLDPNDSDGDTDIANGRFDSIASQIINNLNTPDVIGLQEVQDNTGSLDDGTIAADQTLQTLVDAIAAAGGPTYEFIDNTFITDGASGGQPGGNIRTAFLYNPDRVDLVDGSVQTIGDQNAGSAFEGARLPLVADFEFNAQEVSVVNNHFSSKGGSAPILGIEQPFDARQEDTSVNGSLDERQAQANAVQGFVADALTAEPNANLVVLGDFNEFEFVSPLDTLEQNLTNLTETLPENERYSFIFQGNSQSLDHILVSDSLDEGAEFDIVHVNSEFAETNQRASDHDPLIVSLNLPTPGEVIEGTRRRDNLIGTDGDDTITGFQRRDTLTGGGGNDTFVYTSLRDGRDTITDFEVGSDKIDLSQVLSVVGFEGVDPIADGYVGFRSRPGNTILTIDPDGTAGHGRPRSLLLVQDVDAVALNNPDNFIF
ncbi:MAG: Calx-beta domain-containing protein [Trichodesmium sp. MO_231.B1]|nr:Calx-beta domain-containing protein [Trichodesmium sp. MO_231.B1]